MATALKTNSGNARRGLALKVEGIAFVSVAQPSVRLFVVDCLDNAFETRTAHLEMGAVIISLL